MERNNDLQNKVVQTFAEDMAKIIEEDNTGLVKKIIHGEEEHEKEKINLSPESKRNRFFMFVSLVLILISLSTLSFFLSDKDISVVDVEKQFTPLIFNDRSSFLEVKDFKKDEITQTVLGEINAVEVKSGGVAGIYLTENKKSVGLRRFIALIKGSLVLTSNDTNLVSNNFLMGVVNGQTKDFFILIKMRSTPDIFESLRAWESKMFSDLREFFDVELSSETKYLLTKEFQDGVVENKNARILYDKNNQIVMMYVFANDTSVIITSTENATHEIMLRLASSRVEK